jgi:NADPH:quinone reductase-like Zn-dependent oxidoreductase
LRLVRAAGSLAGRRVLLTGASGGVGHFLTELAAGSGAQVTTVTSSPERGMRLADLGAEAVVLDVREATSPFDVIMESVGGPTFSTALTKLAPGGSVLWYGQAGLEPPVLDFFGLIPVTPFTLRHFAHWASDTSDADDLATLVRLTSTGQLHPEIGRASDWTETAAVLDEVYRRRIHGNAVLTVPGGTNLSFTAETRLCTVGLVPAWRRASRRAARFRRDLHGCLTARQRRFAEISPVQEPKGVQIHEY